MTMTMLHNHRSNKLLLLHNSSSNNTKLPLNLTIRLNNKLMAITLLQTIAAAADPLLVHNVLTICNAVDIDLMVALTLLGTS